MDTGRYDIVVFDIGSSLDQNALCCCEMANHICLVAKEGGSRRKEERLVEYMTFLKGEKLAERMGKVFNYYELQPLEQREETESEEYCEILRTVCRLPAEPEAFKWKSGIRTISLDGTYGRGIKGLVGAVLHSVIL